MSRAVPFDVTEVLRAWRRGDAGAEEALLQTIYTELKNIAAFHLRSERAEHTLQPTALVHEAYLRLLDQRGVDWRDRAHFFGLATIMMRRILVDHARARGRKKRQSIDPDAFTLTVASEPEVDVLDLDRALSELAVPYPRHARIVEMRYFGELDNETIAECLDVSPSTVKRDWNFARAWLRARLAERTPTA